MSVRTSSGGKAEWAAGAGGTNFVEIPELRTWTLSVRKDAKEYASSSTAGGKQRLAGAEDFDGSLSVYIDRSASGTNVSSLDELGIKGGEVGILKLYEDASNFFLAPAYIEEVSYNVDIEGDEIINGDVTFGRNGALTYPT